MTSKLHDIFSELQHAGIHYAVLRSDQKSGTAHLTEMALLLDPAHVKKLTRVLSKLGFARLPNRQVANGTVFICFVQSACSWLQIEIVSELHYGSSQPHIGVPLAHECLQFRQKRDSAYVLAPQHALVTLLLHALLDRGVFDTVAIVQLRKAWKEIAENPAAAAHLDELVSRILAPAITPQLLKKALATSDWPHLLSQQKKLHRQLLRTTPLQALLQKATGRSTHAIATLPKILWRRGISVALLTSDGVVQSSLANSLQQDHTLRMRTLAGIGSGQIASLRLREQAIQPAFAGNGHFSQIEPNGKALREKTINKKPEVHWRQSLSARYQRSQGRFVLLERHFLDAWMTRQSYTFGQNSRDTFFGKYMPKPDLVIFIDTPDWPKQQRQKYLALQMRFPRMVVVDGNRNTNEVEAEVKSLIWSHYRFRNGTKIFHGVGRGNLAAEPAS